MKSNLMSVTRFKKSNIESCEIEVAKRIVAQRASLLVAKPDQENTLAL
ncbi:MAG: hypothetical protein ACK5GD_17595 [Planctomycetota bacterium]